MLLQCLPSSFGSTWLMVWEMMSFEEFQDGCCGGHLGYWGNCPIKFWLNLTYSLGGDVVWRISRSWISEQKILAILNLCVIVMPPIKFQLSRTYSLGGNVIWRISRWLPWWPSWILEQNDFSNSECLPWSFISIQVVVLEEMSKMWKANDGRWRTIDNRPWHKLTWSKAPGELTMMLSEELLKRSICDNSRIIFSSSKKWSMGIGAFWIQFYEHNLFQRQDSMIQ